MPLPTFDSHGDLPVGVHRATLAEVIERFGHGTSQREVVTSRLVHIYGLVQRTGKLLRFVIFSRHDIVEVVPEETS